MNRSLLAIAAMGFSVGSAWAQSSVTIYGVLDLSVQHLKSGNLSPLAGGSLTRVADGHVYGPGSRWGLRVSEDLGSGLRSNVVLESGFTGDNGVSAQGGRLFGRQAFLSLSSDTMGEVRLGRQYIMHDEVTVLNNPFGSTLALNPTAAANTTATSTFPLFIDAPRVDNAVQYISPLFGGFRLQGIVAAGEGTTDRYHGLKGSYSGGPLNIAISYEQSKARAATSGVAAAGDLVNKILELGANYNFGPFRLFGGYQNGKDLTAGSGGVPIIGGVGTQLASLVLPGLTGPATGLRAYTVGVAVPVGATTLGANYIRSKFHNATSDRTLGRISVGATYALSKLTTAYASIGIHNGDLKDYINEKTVFMIGMRKAF